MKKNYDESEMSPAELERPEMQIARALVAVRREKRITQQQLAERTGIAQADISRLENGNSNPSLRTLQRLADGLGMKISVGFQEIRDPDNADDKPAEETASAKAHPGPRAEQPRRTSDGTHEGTSSVPEVHITLPDAFI